MSNIKKFNLTVNNLISDLILVFPDYKYLMVFKEKFSMLAKFNVRKPIEYFQKTVYCFHNEIKANNSDFFLKRDYKNDINVVEENQEWALDQVLNLKDLWKDLTDSNKKIIWSYFNILIKITELEYS
jgi:hypothetical protein